MQLPGDAKHDPALPLKPDHDCPLASALVGAMIQSLAGQRSGAQLAMRPLHARSHLHEHVSFRYSI